jgi:hypothetical protein
MVMTCIRSLALASAVAAFTGMSLAACGGSGSDGGGAGAVSSGSDDEEIRAAAKAFARLRPPGDAKRICELLSPRGEAQFAGVAGAAPGASCVSVISAGSPGLTLSAREVDRAKLSVRDDRALLVYGADEGRLGMRRVDGDWLVDDVLAATLDGPARPTDAALTEGSDEEQVRAVLAAAGKATADRDDARMCGLLGAGAEAQAFAGAVTTGLAGSGATKRRIDVRSCAQALARIRRNGNGTGDGEVAAVFAKLASSRSEVSIRDGRATVSDASGDEALLVREEDRWLLGPNGDPLAAAGQ